MEINKIFKIQKFRRKKKILQLNNQLQTGVKISNQTLYLLSFFFRFALWKSVKNKPRYIINVKSPIGKTMLRNLEKLENILELNGLNYL